MRAAPGPPWAHLPVQSIRLLNRYVGEGILGDCKGDCRAARQRLITGAHGGCCAMTAIGVRTQAGPASTTPATTPAVDPTPNEASTAAAPRRVDDHSTGTKVMQTVAWIGLAGTAIDLARWGAAGKLNAQRGTIGKWLLGIMPMGPGIHNGIVPHEGGMFGKAYAASNSFGTIMAGVNAVAAVTAMGLGVQKGVEDSDGSVLGAITGGASGLVQTREGRIGLLGLIGPAITFGTIFHAGWHARPQGLGAVIAAGQKAEFRGNAKLAWFGVALSPIVLLNLAGVFDGFDSRHDPDKSWLQTAVEGLRNVPRTIHEVRLPFVPDALLGWTDSLAVKHDDAGSAPAG